MPDPIIVPVEPEDSIPPSRLSLDTPRRKGTRKMADSDFIPSGDADFVIWLGNFVTKLTTVHNGTLGITAGQITALNADYANMRYIIADYLPAFDAAKKNRVAYKDLMRKGKTETGVPVPTTAQAIPAATVAVSAPPATPALPNIELRMRLLIRQIKANSFYTLAIGTDLRIVPPSSNTDPATAKPKVVGVAKPSGAVVLTWTKGKYDGVLIECKRGTETTFVFLDKDFKSPYVDTRPNLVAGVPELRTYRVRYLLDDQPVGLFSDDIKISTLV